MIRVVDAGPLTSVQDPLGRPQWRHVGVPSGGAADPWSARLANRLVGNLDGAALLEVTLGGLALDVDAPTWIGVTGGLVPEAGGVAVATNVALHLRSGTTLRLAPGDGARGYVAVAGGLVAEQVLGSASTDLRTGFGGVDGRALRAGDILPTGTPTGTPSRWTGTSAAGPIRLVPGPHPEGFDELLGDWTVGVEADRAGVRLDGPRLDGGEVRSMGTALGAIQAPPDGRPIVMLADRPVTGGYRVPACVIGADIGRVAQLRTGDSLRFASVSMDEAVEALRQMWAQLDALEPITTGDDESGWAGAHA